VQDVRRLFQHEGESTGDNEASRYRFLRRTTSADPASQFICHVVYATICRLDRVHRRENGRQRKLFEQYGDDPSDRPVHGQKSVQLKIDPRTNEGVFAQHDYQEATLLQSNAELVWEGVTGLKLNFVKKYG
jgi:hypothetical protein